MEEFGIFNLIEDVDYANFQKSIYLLKHKSLGSTNPKFWNNIEIFCLTINNIYINFIIFGIGNLMSLLVFISELIYFKIICSNN